jgi:hypothetical protein
MNRREALTTISATLVGSAVAFSEDIPQLIQSIRPANTKFPGVWGVMTLIDQNKEYQYKLRAECINDFSRTVLKLHPNITWMALQFGETWNRKEKPVVIWLKPDKSILDKFPNLVDSNGWVMSYAS